MSAIKNISKSFAQMKKRVFGQRKVAAMLGRADGQVVAGDGIVYATLKTGEVITVSNAKVPNRPYMKVWLGNDDYNPSTMQVLSERFVYGRPLTASLPLHGDKHKFPAEDTVWVDGNQFLPLLAIPGATAYSVKLYGSTVKWIDGAQYVNILPIDLDLSSLIPTDGAIYALLQVDDTGTLTAKAGTQVEAPELLGLADIPLPDTGQLELWAVRLYTGMDRVHKDNQVNDFVDLRWGRGGGSGSGDVVGPASAVDGNLVSYDGATGKLIKDTGIAAADVVTDPATASNDGYMTQAQASKLDGIAAGAEVNVNADWSAVSGDAQILNKPTLGGAAALNVGTAAGTVAAGNDSRFTDARTPTAHATSHKSGGTDAIKLDELAAPTDVTTLNASTTAHGLAPKATAPSSGLINVLGIANGETAYSNKALFDSTAPAALGTASAGSATVAARRDHVHDKQTLLLPFGVYAGVGPFSADATPYAVTIDRTMTLVKLTYSFYVGTNNASNYWTINLVNYSSTVIKALNTSALAGNGFYQLSHTFTATTVDTSDSMLRVQVVKTGTPGSIYPAGPILEVRI